jgi:uncharacterized GH25 family protein
LEVAQTSTAKMADRNRGISKVCYLVVVVVVTSVTVHAHDLFLKLDSYFLPPNSKASVRIFNGTFQESEAGVSPERFQKISLIAPKLAGPITEAITWRTEGKTTVMEIRTGSAGTYLVGVSTKPREIDLKAADFNDYLEHDGIPDTLSRRRQDNELSRDVRERYSKHVRAVFQIGQQLTDDYKLPLNYPAEIIPQQNPYSLKVGNTVTVLCTVDGRPVGNQFVMAGWESNDGKLHSLSTRSGPNGLATVKIEGAGKWFIKMIHMEPVSESGLNYESKWASLTFEIKARTL